MCFLLVDLFLYSYEAEFIQNLIKDKTITDAKAFNLITFRYIDDVLSVNNPNVASWIPLFNPKELKIKETTETASFLDIYLKFDTNCQLQTL